MWWDYDLQVLYLICLTEWVYLCNWNVFLFSLVMLPTSTDVLVCIESSRAYYPIYAQYSCSRLFAAKVTDESLILYFCRCFWTNESSSLRWLFRPLHLCVSLLLQPKGKVFMSSFFWYVLSHVVGVKKLEGHSKQKNHEYLRKLNVVQVKRQLQ